MKLPINNKRFIYLSEVKTSDKTYTREFLFDKEYKPLAIKRTCDDSCITYPLMRKEMGDKIVYKTSLGEYVIFTKDDNVFGEGYYDTDININDLDNLNNSEFMEKTYILDANGILQKEIIRSSANIIATTTINEDGSETLIVDDGKSTIKTTTMYGDNPLEFILSIASNENWNFKEAGTIKRYITYNKSNDSYYICESFEGFEYWRERLIINEQDSGVYYTFKERNSGLCICSFDDDDRDVSSFTSTKENNDVFTKIYMRVSDVNLD